MPPHRRPAAPAFPCTTGRPNVDTPTSDDAPLPSRADLWRRLQLARACLQHGRTDPLLLLAILDGATINELMERE